MKKKILIVGGSGFLGFNLLLKLNKFKNFKITAVSRNIPDYLKKFNKVNLIKADFSKYNSLSKSLKKKNYDIVINFGGNIDHKNKLQTEQSHYKLCKNLIDFFRDKKILFFLQAGSSLEYGRKKFPNEEKDKCKPDAIYGKSKLKSTEYIEKSGLNYIILRLYQIYGPYQKINRIIPLAIFNLKQFQYFQSSAGIQLRDFLYVDDLINLILKILNTKKIKNGIFNVGEGKPISIKQVLKKIEKKINFGKVQFGKLKMRKDEPKVLFPSIKKVKKYYNWYPKIDLETGLRKTIYHYEKKNSISKHSS